MSDNIDEAVERLCELLTDFPLEWEAASPDDDADCWQNEVKHRGADVSVCWDNPAGAAPLEVAINFGGSQARLSKAYADLVYQAVTVMMCNRVEALPPRAEEAA